MASRPYTVNNMILFCESLIFNFRENISLILKKLNINIVFQKFHYRNYQIIDLEIIKLDIEKKKKKAQFSP